MRAFAPTALLLLCISGAAASAQPDDFSDSTSGASGMAGLRGSLAFNNTISAHDNLTPQDTVKANSHVGGGGSFYWGTRLPYGFKVELELLFRAASLDKGTVNGTTGELRGYTDMAGPMANAYWYAPVGDNLLGLHPFIGGGVGYLWNEAGLDNVAGTSFPTVRDDDWRLAYNVMVGASFALNDNSRMTAMYRWLHEDIGINCNSGIKCSGGFSSPSVDLGLEFDL
jgi:opacity protein-like surface antigen